MAARFGRVFRQAFDEVLDGPRTGRYDISELEKTEKTYLGTKVEILCRAEFGLQRGRSMDYLIAGHDVDAKFSVTRLLGQSIPTEALNHICLLMHASDKDSQFSVGLLRITDELLNAGGNKDGKRTISTANLSKITWLVSKGALPENFLLHLPPMIRQRILSAASGQAKIDELFASVRRRVLSRDVVASLARQDDAPKRVRDARIHLRRHGILILGHQNDHPRFAVTFGLPIPEKGSWISVRVVPAESADGRPAILLPDGRAYVEARPDEPAQPSPESY